MKKIYSLLALASIGCIATGAQERQQMTKSAVDISERAVTPNFVRKSAPAKAPESISDIAGEYTLTYIWLLQGNGPGEVTLNVEVADESTGEMTITGFPGVSEMEIQAFADLENGTLSIPNMQLIGVDEYGDNYFYLKGVDENNYVQPGPSDQEATVGTLFGTTVSFPDFDIWAVGNPYDEEAGFWWQSYRNNMQKIVEVDPYEGWEDYDTCSFVDGWVYPGFGCPDPFAYPITCWVQQNIENPSLFRLDNPYSSGDSMLYDTEYLIGDGFIVFDISDPKCVKVLPGVYSGVDIVDNGMSNKIQCVNFEGYYASLGATNEDISMIMEEIGKELDSEIGDLDREIVPASCVDGVIDIPLAVFMIGGRGPSFWDYDTVNIQHSMVFFDEKDPVADSKVDAGIAENAPVEYFNLQGVRVADPAEGQIVIRRQGGKTSKVIIR